MERKAKTSKKNLYGKSNTINWRFVYLAQNWWTYSNF